MRWAEIDNRWNEEYEAGLAEVSGGDMHALALWAVSDPSPRGTTPVDMALIRQIADGSAPEPAALPQYREVNRVGDAQEAARWVVARFG